MEFFAECHHPSLRRESVLAAEESRKKIIQEGGNGRIGRLKAELADRTSYPSYISSRI